MIRERLIDPLVTLWKCSMTLSIRCRFRLEEVCRCRGNLLFLSFSLNILDISRYFKLENWEKGYSMEI